MKVARYDIKGKRFLLVSGALAGIIGASYLGIDNIERKINSEENEGVHRFEKETSFYDKEEVPEKHESSNEDNIYQVVEKDENALKSKHWRDMELDEKVERVKRRYESLPEEGKSQINEYLLGDIVSNEGEKFATKAKDVLDYSASRIKGFFETSSAYNQERNLSELEKYLGGEK